MIEAELKDADVGAQRLQQTQFFPGVQWLDETTVADALGAQLSSGGNGSGSGREPAPGLHGTGIDSVQVGDLTLQPDAANRIAYGPDTEFTVNFTNQGENDEVDVRVVAADRGRPQAAAGRAHGRVGRRGRLGLAHARARLAAAARHAGRDHRRGQARAGRGEDGQQQVDVRRPVLAGVARRLPYPGAAWTS